MWLLLAAAAHAGVLRIPDVCRRGSNGITVEGDDLVVLARDEERVVRCRIQTAGSHRPRVLGVEDVAIGVRIVDVRDAAGAGSRALLGLYGDFPFDMSGDVLLPGDRDAFVTSEGGVAEEIFLCYRSRYCSFAQEGGRVERAPGGLVAFGDEYWRWAVASGTRVGVWSGQGWHVTDVPLDGQGPLAIGADPAGELLLYWAGVHEGVPSLVVRRLRIEADGTPTLAGKTSLALPPGSTNVAAAAPIERPGFALAAASGEIVTLAHAAETCRLTSYRVGAAELAVADERTFVGQCQLHDGPQGLVASGAAFGVTVEDVVRVFHVQEGVLNEVRSLRVAHADPQAPTYWSAVFATDSADCVWLGYSDPPELRCRARTTDSR